MSRELSDSNCDKLLQLYDVDAAAVTVTIEVEILRQLLKTAYISGLDKEVMKVVASIKKDSKTS